MTGPEDLARLLRQWRDLGVRELVFEDLTGGHALELVGKSQRLGADGAAGASRPRVEATGGGPGVDGEGSAAEVGPGPEDEYAALREEALACRRCPLAEGRTQVVFSDGNPAARVMVVGEAPGEREDRTGLPFVGRAGQLLDLMLASVDLSRAESVYICNVLKCRPPGNRNPLREEIESCSPFLLRQIQLVEPEVILAVGTFSGQLLTGEELPLRQLRGRVHTYEGTPLVVTYHPAALLRNPGWTQAAWHDLQLLRTVLDGG